MVKAQYVPKTGDIVWLKFDPQAGKEIQKTRPALTVSPQSYNSKTGLGLFMPVTSQVKGYPFEVIIQTDKIQGVVLCDQIRSMDWIARDAQFITHLSILILDDIIEKLKILLPN